MIPLSVSSSRTADGTARLALRGELDVAGVPEVERALAALEEGGPAHLLIDLRGLSFMDSSGLRLLVAAHARAAAAGRRLSIVRGPHAVQRVLEITGADSRLDLVDDPGEAAGRR